MTADDAGRGSEVIALLRFRKNIGHVVSLVAPRIHVYRRKEDPKGRVQHDAVIRQVVRNAKPGSELKLIRIVQSLGIGLLAPDENERHAVLEHEIGIGETNVFQRTHVFIAQTNLNGCVTSHLKTVLQKRIGVPLAQLHLRNTRLALLHRRQAKQETRQCRAGTIVGSGLRGEAIGDRDIKVVLLWLAR